MLEIVRAVARQLVFSILLDYKYIIIYLFFYLVVKGRYEIIQGFEQCVSKCRSRTMRQMLEELILTGLVTGFAGGILTVALGLYIEPDGLQTFLIIMVLLAFINHRFINPSYAGGLISIYALIFGYDRIHVPSMLTLIAVVQLMEAVLVYLNRKHDNIPIFIQHNGKLTGAFIKQKYYAVPFIMLTLTSIPYTVWNTTINLNWGTIFKTGLLAVGNAVFFLTGAISVTNYSSIAISTSPEEKCRNDSIKFLAGSLLLLIIAFFSGKNEVFKWIGAIFALLYREIMYQHALYRERKKQPLYTVAQRGLRILEIVPDGTAEKMKMKRGEIILTVNGKPVQTEDGIRHVLAKSPTFIWMHTEALNGQIKIYEHWIGKCRNIGNFVCINVESGIGAGIFINGALFRGTGGCAGEIGHLVVDENGRACGCGNNGCLETYASVWHMLQRANERIREGYSSEYVEPEKPIEWNQLVKYARKGDSMCLDILNDSAKFLGYAAAYIINTLNPEAVVIGKCFKQYSFLVIDVLTETAMKKALPYPTSKAVIMVSDYGMNSSALGAAMIPIRKVFGK
jgi:hypothetical protein